MTYASAHNGGRSQVGLNFLQIAGDYAYLNHVKTGQAWTFINTPTPNAPVSPATLDSDGYPTSISNGGIYTRFFIPNQRARSGQYKVDWLGIGTIYCPNASVITGSKTSSTSAGGSFTFTPSTETIDLGISSIGATRITDLRFYHVDDETALNAGEVFGVKFKQRLSDLRPGVIRLMDRQASNLSQQTTWWTRKPVSYVHYASGEYRDSIFCGTTTNSSDDYSVAAPAMSSVTGAAWDGVLRDKTTVSVIFNASASQTGVCTLDVDGSGAKPILNLYTNPCSTGSNTFPVGGSFASLATLIYDATLDAWIKFGGDAA